MNANRDVEAFFEEGVTAYMVIMAMGVNDEFWF
jgi:hypothetical protein